MQCGQRHALKLAGDSDVVQKGIAVEEVISHAVLDALLLEIRAGDVALQGHRAAVVSISKKIKLQFCCDCRRETVCVIPSEHVFQWLPGVHPVQFAVILRVGDHDLSDGGVIPGCRCERT